MTLTQTAIFTKQIIALGIIALTLGTLSFIGYRIWYSYYLTTLPPKEEKPDTKFGILPYPNFPKAYVSSSNFSYTLNTTTGGLPKVGQDPGFEKLTKVYFVIKPYATFLSSDKSRALAEKFNINTPPKVVNETTYEFKQDNKTLVVDLDSGNFKYFKEATPSSKENLDTDENLVSDFKGVLEDLGVLKEELKNGRAKVTLFKTLGAEAVTTNQRTDAQAALISIWPQDLDKKSIFTSDIGRSYIFATLVNYYNSLEDYLSINFTHYQIDTTTFATYPIKSPEEAFNDLQSGKGVIIIEPQRPQVSITSVSLGYFMSENYSPYIQSIFVFEGPSFVAYVPAVSAQFQKQ